MRALAATLALLLPAALLASPPAARSADAPVPFSRSAQPAPGEKKLPWLTFDAAAEQAKKENKHMIVDVYTTWCGWCKVMDRQTYGNPEVADYLLQNFVLAKVNGESAAELHWNGKTMSERAFVRAIGVTGFPTTYFLKPNAEMIGGAPGFIRPGDFMIYAKYVSTKWYEKGTPKQYLESMKTEPQSSN
jgi:thioredoxin-related protein